MQAAARRQDEREEEASAGYGFSYRARLPVRKEERVAAICDAVIDLAAALFNVSGRELRQPGRSTKQISRVRQVAMYTSHVTLGLSMAEVGAGFGRDRTTVLHACHLIEDLRDDPVFDQVVGQTERVMKAAFGIEELAACGQA